MLHHPAHSPLVELYAGDGHQQIARQFFGPRDLRHQGLLVTLFPVTTGGADILETRMFAGTRPAPPTGLAGGGLAGTYPNPRVVAENADTILANRTFTGARPAPPTGLAGGDLTGTYPNPQVRPELLTGADILETRMFAGTRPAPPTGLAGGDLKGVYPNPGVIAENANLILAAATFGPRRPAQPTGLARGDLSGTYPNPSVATKHRPRCAIFKLENPP